MKTPRPLIGNAELQHAHVYLSIRKAECRCRPDSATRRPCASHPERDHRRSVLATPSSAALYPLELDSSDDRIRLTLLLPVYPTEHLDELLWGHVWAAFPDDVKLVDGIKRFLSGTQYLADAQSFNLLLAYTPP